MHAGQMLSIAATLHASAAFIKGKTGRDNQPGVCVYDLAARRWLLQIIVHAMRGFGRESKVTEEMYCLPAATTSIANFSWGAIQPQEAAVVILLLLDVTDQCFSLSLYLQIGTWT